MCLAYRVRIDERVRAMFDLCPPDIGSMSEIVRGGPISLTDKGFGLWWILADKPYWWSKRWSDA
jgi:hypothetical protein